MSKIANTKGRQWVRPELKKLSAGSAEANLPSGTDDGGPVGNARS